MYRWKQMEIDMNVLMYSMHLVTWYITWCFPTTLVLNFTRLLRSSQNTVSQPWFENGSEFFFSVVPTWVFGRVICQKHWENKPMDQKIAIWNNLESSKTKQCGCFSFQWENLTATMNSF